MLRALKIQNLALIESATLEFDDRLNVISGETGAGKSMLLDGLSFVFGGRADKSLIRNGATSMRVEVVFANLKDVGNWKNKYGLDVDGELFISRELDVNGKNTCRINGELFSVGVIKDICKELVDIHGQSEHLSILNNDFQLKIIDLFNKENTIKLENLNNLIDQVKEIENEINALGGDKTSKQNLIDLYTYQKNEIEQADLKPNEYENLSEEFKNMQQYEKINLALGSAKSCLEDDGLGDSAIARISNAAKFIAPMSNMSSKYEELFSRLQGIKIETEDILDTITSALDSNVFDEARFEYIDHRLDEIKTLFRKYGQGQDAVLSYYNEISKKLDSLINSEVKYNELTEKKEKLLNKIDILQEEISQNRKKSAKVLTDAMVKELAELSMPKAKLSVNFSRISDRYSRTGFDFVDFQFSANAGFEAKSLNKVVSGGEMSRVMLAYKIVVGEVDNISTIIFDEIDTGLSGDVALTVAKYLIKLGETKQIIAVSHLPQICAAADSNIYVEKMQNDATTVSRAIKLDESGTYQEIGRLMGDDKENGMVSGKRLKEVLSKCKMVIKNK